MEGCLDRGREEGIERGKEAGWEGGRKGCICRFKTTGEGGLGEKKAPSLTEGSQCAGTCVRWGRMALR